MKIHIALLLLVLLIMACGPSRGGAATENTRNDSELQATIWSKHRWYENDQPIQLRFTLQNITDETVVLERNDGLPVIDLITDEDTPRRWSDGPGLNQDLTRLVLEPGEQYTIEWTLPPLHNTRLELIALWWSLGIREETVGIGICQGVIGYC